MEILRNIRRKILGQPLKESSRAMFEAIVDVSTGGEAGEALGTPPTVEILKPGNLLHKHTIKPLPWEQNLGSQVIDFQEFTATFKNRVGCETCDYEAVVSKRALY